MLAIYNKFAYARQHPKFCPQSLLLMNKDALLATLIGFGIGLFITGAFLFGPNILRNLPSFSFNLPSFGQQLTVSPVPSLAPRVTNLTVSAPIAESISESDELLVSGTAPAGSTLVVAGPEDEAVVIANEGNTFAGTVTLVEGKNDIIVTAYIEQKEESVEITVYYTPEEL